MVALVKDTIVVCMHRENAIIGNLARISHRSKLGKAIYPWPSHTDISLCSALVSLIWDLSPRSFYLEVSVPSFQLVGLWAVPLQLEEHSLEVTHLLVHIHDCINLALQLLKLRIASSLYQMDRLQVLSSFGLISTPTATRVRDRMRLSTAYAILFYISESSPLITFLGTFGLGVSGRWTLVSTFPVLSAFSRDVRHYKCERISTFSTDLACCTSFRVRKLWNFS